MNNYERTVTAALTETRGKFALAEALAMDVPPMRTGPTREDEQGLAAYMEEARQAIVAAGGEPRAVGTLKNYRWTALWVSNEIIGNFDWVEGASFSAHDQARLAGLSRDEFAALPKKTTDAIRRETGRAGTDGPPERIVESWTSEQRASVAKELLSDPDVAEQIADEITEHVASDNKRTAEVISKRRETEAKQAPASEPESRPVRDYDAMVEQSVNLLSVALAAESSGKWTPSERAEALLYFLTQVLGDRKAPTGEQAEFVNEKLNALFDEVEAYANSEVS